MKKRFLSILLTAALAFGGIGAPSMAASVVNAAAIPDTMPDTVKQAVKTMSNEELIELLETVHAKNPNYNPDDTSDAALLNNDCTFLTGQDVAMIFRANGGWTLWLNPAEEEILRQRFPDIFKGIPSPVALDAGEDAEDVIINYSQVKDSADSESGIAPDFEKIVKILERGQYTVSLTGTISTSCTKNVKVAQKYTATASYKLTASDGGDIDATDISVSIDYNRKKPTKLKVTCNLPDGQEFSKTLTLKMSASLQKKIKTGKVVLSGSNYSSYGNESEISLDKNVTAKSGKINLAFKFKTKK